MTFLSKLGQVIATAGKFFGGPVGTAIGGAISAFLPKGSALAQNVQTAEDIFMKVSGLVIQMEAFGAALNLTGQQKLDALVDPVVNLLLQSDAFTGKHIDNPALLREAATDLINGTVKAYNSIHHGEVKDSDIPGFDASKAPKVVAASTPQTQNIPT
jgi:hypothetical protein